jgi:hypothetical protein
MIQFADSAMDSGRREGQLAAILVYQQLIEEWLHVVDYWCHFERALGIFPTESVYSAPDRITFGQLIDRVGRLQTFDYKEQLLGACRRLNVQVRNKAVHKLLLDGNFENLPNMVHMARLCCEEATDFIPRIQECFFARFNRLAAQLSIPDRRQD